jgi:hypothetical protein
VKLGVGFVLSVEEKGRRRFGEGLAIQFPASLD